MKMGRLFICLLCVSIMSASVAYADRDDRVSGSLDMNYTFDTRDMNRLTLDTLIFFPYRITYYNVFHMNSLMDTPGDNFDIDNIYHEQDLWWAPFENIPVDAVVQLQVIQGTINDQLRAGFRWRISDTSFLKAFFENIHLFLTSQFHPIQTHFYDVAGYGFSFEHYWRVQVLPETFDDRVYVAGYLDHNLNYGGTTNGDNHSFSTETQLGVRVIGHLNAITEFRYSDYDVKSTGVAFGLEYVVPF